MTLAVWRHPRPEGVLGRCIGQTDVPVCRRKARRLAHRIRQWQRRHGGPRVVFTSDLRRCALVGRQLKAWGWRHRIDPALREMFFGDWEGRRWSDIARAEVDAWVADFLHHAPGGGESLSQVLARAAAWRPEIDGACVVAHAGWMQACAWLALPADARPPLRAELWPRAPAYGALTVWPSAGPLASAASSPSASPLPSPPPP